MTHKQRRTSKDKHQMESTPISISEFRAWLAGVEDMQEAGWFPNMEQWGRIRAKILSVSDVGEQAHIKKLLVEPQTQAHDKIPTLSDLAVTQEQPSPNPQWIVGFDPDPPHVGGSAPVRNFATAVGSIKTPDIEADPDGYKPSFI